MTIAVGSSLGRYEIRATLRVGGMSKFIWPRTPSST